MKQEYIIYPLDKKGNISINYILEIPKQNTLEVVTPR